MKALEASFKKVLQNSSPFWQKHQKSAFRQLERVGIPDKNTEDFLYTSVTDFFLPNELEKGNTVEKVSLPEYHILPISEIEDTPLKDKYNTIANNENSLTAINTAFAEDGFILHITKTTESPIVIQAEISQFSRNLVKIDKGVNVKIIWKPIVEGDTGNMCTEMFIDEGAVVENYFIQHSNNTISLTNSLYIKQEKNSEVNSFLFSLNGKLIRNDYVNDFQGENARHSLYSIGVPSETQHFDLNAVMRHSVPDCKSNQVIKNITNNKGVSVFSGLVEIVADAQRSEAFQQNKNIVLTDEAKAFTKPQLLIDADDVKCSHGATVGQIDKNALFYMQSRGISYDDSKLLLLHAFLEEVVQKVDIDVIREVVEETLNEKLQ